MTKNCEDIKLLEISIKLLSDVDLPKQILKGR